MKSPQTTWGVSPIRLTRLPAIGATTDTVAVQGSILRPAPNGL
ncbi:hypothetical protein [Paenibacillus phytorum]|nr:hypothetical protein [Paenibacillus phytorum]